MLGSQKIAEQATEIVKNGNWVNDFRDDVPEGFEVLGNGASRVAILGPDGIVYKVDMYSSGDGYNYDDDGAQSVVEAEFFEILRGYGVPWIPDVTIWNTEDYTVTAMRQFFQTWSEWAWENDQSFRKIRDNGENVERWRQMTAIVKSDLKPANVGVDENGLLFLLDGGVESSDRIDPDRIRRQLNGEELPEDDDDYDDEYDGSCDCSECRSVVW